MMRGVLKVAAPFGPSSPGRLVRSATHQFPISNLKFQISRTELGKATAPARMVPFDCPAAHSMNLCRSQCHDFQMTQFYRGSSNLPLNLNGNQLLSS